LGVNSFEHEGAIDHEGLTLNGVVGALAGVEAFGKRQETDYKTIEMMSVMGQAAGDRGITSRFGHGGLSEDGTGKKVALARNFRTNGDALVCDFVFLESARRSPVFTQDPIEYIMSMAKNSPRELALSAVMPHYTVWVMPDGSELKTDEREDWFREVRAERNGRPVEATTKLPIIRPISFERLDFVSDGALTRGLFPDADFSLFLSGDSARAEKVFYLLDEFREEYNLTPEQLRVKIEGIFNKYQFFDSHHTGGNTVDEKDRKEVKQDTSGDAVLEAVLGLGDGMKNMLEAMKEGFASLQPLQMPGPEQIVEEMGIAPTPNVQVGNNGADYAAEAVDYLFGVDGTPLPKAQMRNPRDVYFALTGDYDFHGVFRRDEFTQGTTSVLADLSVDSLNKVVASQFAKLKAYRWYEQLVSVEPNDGTLHAMKWITHGGLSNLPTVTEGGAYTELALADAKESDAFLKKGGYVAVTLEMFRNSEIARIQAVPLALALASVRTRSAKFAAIFTDNSGVGPTLDEDSTALFHADHSNVATTAIGTSTAAWIAAAVECFAHTELGSGTKIAVNPRFCLTPNDLRYTALENFGYGAGWPTSYDYHADPANQLNQEDPRPIVVAVPDWTDANDWAYLADPAVWPVLHVSFAQASAGRKFPPPEIYVASGETNGLMFTNDALPAKVRDLYAAGVSSAKGIGKRNVT
jgi:hypothetical protein